MPTPYVKKEAEKHHESTEKSEATWQKAKEQARKEYGQADNHEFWAEVMSIYKSMMGDKK